MRYSRDCGSYQDFLDRRLLLTRKLLNQVITSIVSRLIWPLRNICVTNDYRYVPLFLSTSRSFPRSWLIIRFLTGLTRRVPLVEQELPTFPEHLSSPPVFSGVRVTRSLVLWECFVEHNLSFCTFFVIMLSILLRCTDSDYPYGIFNLFVVSWYGLIKTYWFHKQNSYKNSRELSRT